MMRLFIGLLVVLLAAPAAMAHRLSVFAYEAEGQLQVESFFSGNRPSRHCPVVLTAEKGGKELARAMTDEQGKAALPLPGVDGGVLVVVNCGDGHRGEWLYQQEIVAAPADMTVVEETTPQVVTSGLDEKQLRRLIASELDKQLAPLRRQLAMESDHQPSLQDVLGGIGYLLGLAGIVAYMRSRPR